MNTNDKKLQKFLKDNESKIKGEGFLDFIVRNIRPTAAGAAVAFMPIYFAIKHNIIELATANPLALSAIAVGAVGGAIIGRFFNNKKDKEIIDELTKEFYDNIKKNGVDNSIDTSIDTTMKLGNIGDIRVPIVQRKYDGKTK